MNIIDLLTRYVRPYYKFLLIIFIIIIFSLVGYYVYRRYSVKTNGNKFKDVANANRRNKATVMFFYVDWCPHCKTAKPEWDKFVSKMNGNEINGYIIECVETNCTDDGDSNVNHLINQYKIEAYPTIKMLKDDNVIEFQSKITKETLNIFVNTMV